MIFWQLLLAHLIGDFPLQFNEIFKLKVKSKWGVLLHCAIVVMISVLFLVPYVFAMQMWCGIIILICSHFIIDWTRVVLSKKANLDNLWMFLLDQGLHILIVWFVSLMIISPPLFILPDFIRGVLENKQVILTMSGLIAAGYFGAILIHYLKKMFIKGYMSQSLSTKRYGIIERLLVMVLILMPGLSFLFIPTVLFARMSISRVKEEEYSLFDSIISTALAVIFGLILKVFVWL
ncbi:MAG: DUF3307 domain-containing protein [Nitrospirota bacterium]